MRAFSQHVYLSSVSRKSVLSQKKTEGTYYNIKLDMAFFLVAKHKKLVGFKKKISCLHYAPTGFYYFAQAKKTSARVGGSGGAFPAGPFFVYLWSFSFRAAFCFMFYVLF
jgi:hypothetical protein